MVAKDCLFLPKIPFDAEPQWRKTTDRMLSVKCIFETISGHNSPTCQAVPLVDGKEAVGGDGDDGR